MAGLPGTEAQQKIRENLGRADVFAAHARNLRRLRNALCAEMMKALR